MVNRLDIKSAISFLAKVIMPIIGMASFSFAAEIEVQLDRDSVPAGNGALLTLKISGSNASEPQLPQVENLIFNSRGQSKQIQMFNGNTSVSITYTYAVGSNIPGEYEIPGIDVTIDGEKVTSQPLKLKVTDNGAAQPPTGVPPNAAGQQPQEQEQPESDEKRFGFLTVDLADSERKHAYVGEIAPVRIRAWLPVDARAQLRSGIQPEGKGFTLHHVSEQPQQTQETRDGKRYLVVTWFGGISATKAGKYPASLSVSAKIAVRDTSAPRPQRRQRGGPFDDPFFDNVFDQMDVPMIEKDVTLKSDDQEIEVRPLPTEDRPAGFTGAVGEFKFEGVKIPSAWKTGEPQQISARLGGSGNFALMNAPQVTPQDAWKIYPGKDEFQAGDQASFSGSKSFQFSAVPRKSGNQETSLSFSYFDPVAEKYRTLTTPPQKIEVTGKDMVDDEPVAAPATKEPEKKSNLIAAQHLKMTRKSSLIPLISRPSFIPLFVISVALGVLGGILAWLRYRGEDPKRRLLAAVEKATREALETVKQCVVNQDVSGFFAAARLAIQHRLSVLWNQPAQAITLAEVNARTPENSPVARFFREADHYEYSRKSQSGVLPEWQTLLDEAMASLSSTAR
jgi:BatD DUF11 like domain